MRRAALDLGTSQACAMKIPAAYPEPANPASLGVKRCEGVDEVESEMTQPAKVQEPSMEEILASIRRIIADDEAKPRGRRKSPRSPCAPAAKPEKPAQRRRPPRRRSMNDIPPSTIAPRRRRRKGGAAAGRSGAAASAPRRQRATTRTTSTRC